MKVKNLATELFRARPKTPFFGYLPATLVVIFFGLYALHEGFVETVPYLVLLAVCGVQLWFRTLAGWLLLLAVFCFYAVAVAIQPQNGPTGEYILFLSCGAVPAAFLLASFPRSTRVEMQQDPVSDSKTT